MIGPQEGGGGAAAQSVSGLTAAEEEAAQRFKNALESSNTSQRESLQAKFDDATVGMALMVASVVSMQLSRLCPDMETKDAVIHLLDTIAKDSQKCREVDPEGFAAFVKKGQSS